MTDFYVVSLNHTQPRIDARRRGVRGIQPFVVFWRPKDSDYCNCIEHAGLYSAQRIAEHPTYYDQHFNPTPGRATFAVAREVVERYLKPIEHESTGKWPAAVDGPGHVVFLYNLRRLLAAEARRRRIAGGLLPTPVRVSLKCPQCSVKHLDVGEWETRPHKTHRCLACGNEWRHASFPTCGADIERAEFM